MMDNELPGQESAELIYAALSGVMEAAEAEGVTLDPEGIVYALATFYSQIWTAAEWEGAAPISIFESIYEEVTDG